MIMLPPCRAFWSVRFLVGLGLASLTTPAHAESGPDAKRAELVREILDTKERVRALEARLRQLDSRRSAPARREAVDQPSNVDVCARPFFLDAAGFKHVRAECALKVSPCEFPFTLDENGFKRVRSQCRAETAGNRGQ
jgi:hypothetical protein